MKTLAPLLFAAALAAFLHLAFMVVPAVALPLALTYFIGALLALSYYDYHRHYSRHR